MYVDDNGTGNVVTCDHTEPDKLDLRVVFTGDDNRLHIGANQAITGSYIEIGSHCAVTIGNDCVLQSMFVYVLKDSTVKLGENVSFNAKVRLLLHEPSHMSIGSGSLIGNDVDLTTSDMHSILNAQTGERINHARDIRVDRNVWIGQRAMILKGADIGANAVIAAGAIVAGPIPANTVAGGIPAKVIRSGVRWDRRLL